MHDRPIAALSADPLNAQHNGPIAQVGCQRTTNRGLCYGNSVCLSVCLCVTGVLCIKTAKRFVEILLPPDSPIILVFWHGGSLLWRLHP